MPPDSRAVSLEERIEQWRTALRRRQASHSVDVAELEILLREELAVLSAAGLDPDESFLLAVKRVGDQHALAREYAAEHSEQLWKQLVAAPPESVDSHTRARTDAVVAICLALAAAAAVKLPALFGMDMDRDEGFYVRNIALCVLPMLTGYFVWKRGIASGALKWLALAFVAAAAFANIYPFAPRGSTEALTALHLPVALWLVVGIAYAGGRWRAVDGRMDFIRFSGELFIQYVLIALGGGVLTGFLMMLFKTIGIDAELFVQSWLVPCGAAGAVLVASWLVDARQGLVENMAPVLTRLFTPLFAALLVVFLGALLLTGRGISIERDMLAAFDLLLVVVLALLLYCVSARPSEAPPGAFDVMQIVLVISALLADAVALWAIAARIGEYGLSPNRVAVLGVNIILLVNLAWSAVLYVRFLRGHGRFAALERWQTNYLPVYSAWAATVVVAFPPVFGYR